MNDLELRTISGFPNYFAGSDGHIYSTKLGRLICLKAGVVKNGRLHVSLSKQGKSYQHYVHHLIAEAFLGPKPKGLYVLHGPEGHLDNRPENLRYGTQKENMQDRKRDGTEILGQNHPNSKLSNLQVLEIRKLCHEGVLLRKVAEQFNISLASVCMIRKRQTWKHLP